MGVKVEGSAVQRWHSKQAEARHVFQDQGVLKLWIVQDLLKYYLHQVRQHEVNALLLSQAWGASKRKAWFQFFSAYSGMQETATPDEICCLRCTRAIWSLKLLNIESSSKYCWSLRFGSVKKKTQCCSKPLHQDREIVKSNKSQAHPMAPQSSWPFCVLSEDWTRCMAILISCDDRPFLGGCVWLLNRLVWSTETESANP